LAATTPWGFATVERRSTTDQVLQELRAAILAGRLKPTEQLPEATLARAFGTGRSAIREALRQLVQEGLVVSELNRGARVVPLAADDMIDVYRARTAIEVAAVDVVLERPQAPDLTALLAAQEAIRRAGGGEVSGPPSRELVAADMDFHRAMVALAGSARLSRAHEPLVAESQMLLNWHPVYSRSDYVTDHQVLVDAIERRDPTAGDAVRAHLTLTIRLLAEEATRYADRLASAQPIVDNHRHNEGRLG